eukprot:8784757-Pyramimonas_sp.AAC.1
MNGKCITIFRKPTSAYHTGSRRYTVNLHYRQELSLVQCGHGNLALPARGRGLMEEDVEAKKE